MGYRLSPQQRQRWRVSKDEICSLTAQIPTRIDSTGLFEAIARSAARHEILRTQFTSAPGILYPLQDIEEAPRGEFGRLNVALETSGQSNCTVTLSASVLCADSHSLANLLTEALLEYRGEIGSYEPVQYADYSAWANGLIDAAESTTGREYWSKAHQAGARRVELPLAHASRGPGQAGSSRMSLERDYLGSSSQLLAVWASLMAEHTASTQVVVGVAADGRSQPDLRGAIGPYERLLPLVVHVHPSAGMDQIAGAIEESRPIAEGWQDCYESSDSHPGFVASFEESFGPAAVLTGGFTVTSCSPVPGRAPLHLVRRGSRIELIFDRDVYSDEGAAEIARQLNASLGPVNAAETLLDLFDRHVRANPGQMAVVSREASLTYRELDLRARRLASELRRRGIGQGTLVPLFFDRTADYITAILAVLRAGAAWVPLDSSYPPQRIQYFLERIGSPLLVTQKDVRDKLEGVQGEIVLVDDPVSGELTDLASPCALDTAYVIFTSGSTGEPKGVAVSHGSLLASTLGRKSVYRRDVERLLLLAALSFDSSVAGVCWTLADGGTLHLAESDATRDPKRIGEAIERHRITHIQLLPSLYQMLLQEGGSLPSLRCVTVAGEVCPPALIDLHRQVLPSTILVNEYGPTESTIWSSAYVCSSSGGTRVPLGSAAPHVTLRVADAYLRPVPCGVPGEIVIGGAGLAKGYLNDPAFTAARFVPDECSASPGARVYRTGDRGFLQPGGSLEFLGRVDEQVKVRGFRVEPLEIEAVLLDRPEIAEACVIARTEKGSTSLHAFVVCRNAYTSNADLLRSAMRIRLPEYMVPSSVTVLSELPRLPNGKIDRGSMGKWSIRRSNSSVFAAAETPLQEELIAIWRAVMQIDRVGIHDSFFDLGGDSIQILRVRSEAGRRGLRFELRDMLDAPTVAGLEKAILRAAQGASADSVPMPFSLLPAELTEKLHGRSDIEDAFPAASLQADMLRQTQQSNSGLYHDVMTCRLRIVFDAGRLIRALAQMFSSHGILRTSFEQLESDWFQCVRPSVSLPLETVDLRGLAPEEQESRIAAFLRREPLRQFDPFVAPLVRFTIHRLGSDVCQFSLASHHAVLDGWSASSLLGELLAVYVGAAPALVPPSYSCFVALEQKAAADPAARAFWERYLKGAKPSRIGSAVAGSTLRSLCTTTMAPGVLAALSHVAFEERVPLKSVLLAGWLKALAAISGEKQVLSGMFAHGRPEQEHADRTLGLFLNFVPIRLDTRAGYREAIRAVAADENAMLPHIRFPRRLIEQTSGQEPLFDMVFNYLDLPVPTGVEILSTHAVNVNEFALTAVFRKTQGGMQTEMHFDAARIGSERVASISRELFSALECMTEQAQELA